MRGRCSSTASSMGMYVDRPPVGEGGSRELEQGDVLADVLWPTLPHDRSFGFQRQAADKKEGFRWFWKANFKADELLEQEGKELRVMSKLVREPFALVLSNSCDNYSGEGPVLLAPIRPFEHYDSAAISLRKALNDVVNTFAPRCGEDGCQGLALSRRVPGDTPICADCATKLDKAQVTTPESLASLRAAAAHIASEEQQERMRRAELWSSISRIATGANPKRLYMPGDPARTFSRSEAHLLLAQPLQGVFLTRELKELRVTRAFGLGPEGIRHLQYTVESFFGRNPRDDSAWPSMEDLGLKAIWLEEELERASLDEETRADYQVEVKRIRGVLRQGASTGGASPGR
jgi:hypothetical protein